MLTPKINEVVTLKLVSGEEVIGYFVAEDAESIVLRKPLVPVATGQGSIGLAPFVMSSDYLKPGANVDIPFNKQTIISTVPTEKQFADAYTQQVSGIDMSASGKPGLITT